MNFPFDPKSSHLFADCRGKCTKEYGIDKLPCNNDFGKCKYKPENKKKTESLEKWLE